MKVLVAGSSGCVGSAIALALRAQGHTVIEGVRNLAKLSQTQPNERVLELNYALPLTPAQWAVRLRGVDAVVNAVGILMERKSSSSASAQTFAQVHGAGPRALFAGAALARVKRVVQVSALGAGTGTSPYLSSKREADDALMQLGATDGLQYAVLRPSLIYGPRSQSARVFKALAALPVIALPGKGAQLMQPLHSYELGQIVCNLLESPAPLQAVLELGGPQALSYRELLQTWRTAQGGGLFGLKSALWLNMPLPLMRLGARLAESLPQQVFSRDTLAMLEQGSCPAAGQNAAEQWLGRAPTALADGLLLQPHAPITKNSKDKYAPVVDRYKNSATNSEFNRQKQINAAQHGSGLRART